MARYAEGLVNVVASLLLFLTAALTLVDVVGRNVFAHPIPGATELTELALVGMTFLLYPRLALRQQHIVIDLLDRVMGPVMRRLQQALSGLLGAVLFGAIGWRLWVLGERSAGYGDVTAYLKLPIYPAFYFMSVAALVAAAAFLMIVVTAFTAPGSAFLRDEAEPKLGYE